MKVVAKIEMTPDGTLVIKSDESAIPSRSFRLRAGETLHVNEDGTVYAPFARVAWIESEESSDPADIVRDGLIKQMSSLGMVLTAELPTLHERVDVANAYAGLAEAFAQLEGPVL